MEQREAKTAADDKGGSWVWWTAGTIVALAAIAAIVYLQLRPEPPPPPPVPAALPAPPASPPPPPAPATRPTPTAAPAAPLPALDESDKPVLSAAMELLGQSAVQRFVVPEQVVRRIVATVDNLPRQKLPMQSRPIHPTPGQFVASGSEEAPVLDAENYTRYRPFIALIDATDAEALVGLYRRFYPLFDEAYQSLGNGDGDFNTRLRAVVDHLLAAPEPSGPIRLERPNVLYTYADPELEALSAGQKLMIRIGRENELVIKQKLREIRAALP